MPPTYPLPVPVHEGLIADACAALHVSDHGSLGEGGQKSVRSVEILALPAEPDLSEGEEVEPPFELMVVGREPGTSAVLKVIQLGVTTPEALERAQREVLLLQRIKSPNVVRVLSDLVILGEPPKCAAWLEELLPGQDLAAVVTKHRWNEAETIELMVQVARGVGEMHADRVTHRDLSPNNIRVAEADRFVVMDPGYARHELLPGITVMGQPGTPGFMSPEHLRHPPSGPTSFSDVFCIGILGYLALVGSPPIPYTGDAADYSARLATAHHTKIEEVRTDLRPELTAAINRCLHPQPARRFLNGHDLAGALEGLI